MPRPFRLLCICNTPLPDGDYRACYGRDSTVARVRYGLPKRPAGVQPDDFVQMSFGEGVAALDLFRFLRLFVYLRRHRNQYDLVHFYTTKLQLLGPICAYLAGVQCIRTVNGFGRTFNRGGLRYRLLRPIYMWLTGLATRLSEATLLQNRGDLQWLCKKLPHEAGKLHWVGSGVDASRIEDKDFEADPLRVLMVSRLMPDKGVRTFLAAAAELRSDRFQFTLVGPPSKRSRSLLHEVQQAHRDGTVTYLGALESADLSAVYRSYQVFVLPSSGEGMPRVMLEAGHALLCPVASDIPAHRDLIAPGRGFLISGPSTGGGRDTTSSRELVRHLERLAADRQMLAENARGYQQHVIDNFAIDEYVSRLDRLVMQIVRGGAVAAPPAAHQARRAA